MPPQPPRRPTLADIARRAGVSVALASIVMRDAPGASARTRARVRREADKLGYRPDTRARLLRSTHSRLIGVMFGIEHDFHADLVSRLYEAADRQGYDLAISAVGPGRAEERALSSLLDDRCEALILLGPVTPTSRLNALAERLPVVVAVRQVRARNVDVVRTADDQGAEEAVRHLIGLGHRDILHVDGGRSAGASERRNGYRRAMAGAGLSRYERYVPGGLTDADGSRAARQVMALRRRPTAITAFNDRCAVGMIDVFRGGAVRVPQDMSVVGYDDSPLARLASFSLTTIAQDSARIAALAVDRAVQRLSGATELQRQQLVAPHLIVRESSGPPQPASSDISML